MKRIVGFSMRVLMLASVLLLPACQADRSPVFSDQCSPPCWRGIEPGKTTWQQTLEMVREFQDVDADSIETTHGSWYIFSHYMKFKLTSRETVGVYLLNDIVAGIHIRDLNGGLSLGKYIDTFGEPEYAATLTKLGPGIPILPSDAKHTWFFGLAPFKGVAFAYDTLSAWQFDSDFALDKGTKISDIEFFDPDKYDQLLENGFIVYDLDGFSKDRLYPWKGYGDIRTLYPEK